MRNVRIDLLKQAKIFDSARKRILEILFQNPKGCITEQIKQILNADNEQDTRCLALFLTAVLINYDPPQKAHKFFKKYALDDEELVALEKAGFMQGLFKLAEQQNSTLRANELLRLEAHSRTNDILSKDDEISLLKSDLLQIIKTAENSLTKNRVRGGSI